MKLALSEGVGFFFFLFFFPAKLLISFLSQIARMQLKKKKIEKVNSPPQEGVRFYPVNK